tara:strand:- start:16166 stop:17131 length:966 start_codon:yes stop_codon:yes gene_type:complete
VNDVSVSIVNYKSSKLIEDCIQSIIDLTFDLNYEIIVVDNNSNDDIEEIISKFEKIKLIKLEKNIGFAAANNIALELSNSEFFLLLNPDTYLKNNALKILFNFMKVNQNCAISCPQLYYPNGKAQQSYTNFRTPYQRMMWDLYPLLSKLKVYKIFKKLKNKSLPKKNSINIDKQERFKKIERPRGVCFFVRKSMIKIIGPMDERFFMYCEEVDWAYRFFNSGYENYICYEAKVFHIWGGTSKTQKHKLNQIQIQSDYKYFMKHFGVFGLLQILFGNFFASILCLNFIILYFTKKKRRNLYFNKFKFHLECLFLLTKKIKIE